MAQTYLGRLRNTEPQDPDFPQHTRFEGCGQSRPSIDTIQKVLTKPRFHLYDIVAQAHVAMGETKIAGVVTALVVVYTRRNDTYHIVTVYPCTSYHSHAERKVRRGRWIWIAEKGSTR